jgi:hypothetical protein
MTAPHDDLARKLATRLAPTSDKSLPALVERVLAEGGEAEAGPALKHSFDADLWLKIAGFVVTVAKTAWDIGKGLRAEKEKKKQAEKEAAQQARIETLEQRVAYLEGVIQSRLRIEVDVPPDVPTRIRDDAFKAAAEEVAAEEAAAEEPQRMRIKV